LKETWNPMWLALEALQYAQKSPPPECKLKNAEGSCASLEEVGGARKLRIAREFMDDLALKEIFRGMRGILIQCACFGGVLAGMILIELCALCLRKCIRAPLESPKRKAKIIVCVFLFVAWLCATASDYTEEIAGLKFFDQRDYWMEMETHVWALGIWLGVYSAFYDDFWERVAVEDEPVDRAGRRLPHAEVARHGLGLLLVLNKLRLLAVLMFHSYERNK